MKQIEVVAAIIRKKDKIFATQRGYGEWKDWWEFPGGKMEAGETPEEALKREIREELSTEISVDEFLCTVEYDYPKVGRWPSLLTLGKLKASFVFPSLNRSLPSHHALLSLLATDRGVAFERTRGGEVVGERRTGQREVVAG